MFLFYDLMHFQYHLIFLLLQPVISSNLSAPNHVLREMCKRYQEYTEPTTVRIAVGTYNVNGGKQFRSSNFTEENLYDWLLDAHLNDKDNLVNITSSDEELAKPADIYAIGFEEIVDLNAANIMNSSTENAKMWAKMLMKALCRDREYVLLTYQQLVGVCLYIFVMPEHVPFIKDVAVDSVKTGLGGHTGNKGNFNKAYTNFRLYFTYFPLSYSNHTLSVEYVLKIHFYSYLEISYPCKECRQGLLPLILNVF